MSGCLYAYILFFEAWSFAIARLGSARPVAETAVEILGSFQPQGLANTCWALARLAAEGGTCERRLLDFVALEVSQRAADFSPQGLANIGWAFATLVVCGARGRERCESCDGSERWWDLLHVHVIHLVHLV